MSEASLSRSCAAYPGKPRVSGSYSSASYRVHRFANFLSLMKKRPVLDVRFLHRVCSEVRVTPRVDILHGHVRLPDALGGHRRQDLLRTWRCETLRIHGSALIYSSELALGLSPSIHSIDQIKVVDRFRGTCCALSCFSQAYWWCS